MISASCIDIPVDKKRLDSFVSNYSIGNLLSFHPLKKGFANKMFKIKTTQGEYVLKIAVRNNPYRVRYEIDLLNFLKKLPVPQPIKTNDNTYLVQYDTQKAFLYPFLHGEQQDTLSNDMLFQVGSFLGELHHQTKKFHSSVKRIEFYPLSLHIWRRKIRNSKKIRNQMIQKALLFISEKIPLYILPNNLPQGAIHADLKPENVVFVKNRLTGVVDFDNSYKGPLVLDLALAMMWFCSSRGKFSLDKAKHMYAGYITKRRLYVCEKKCLSDALHFSFLSVVVQGIYELSAGLLPEKYILEIMENLLEAEKTLSISKKDVLLYLENF